MYGPSGMASAVHPCHNACMTRPEMHAPFVQVRIPMHLYRELSALARTERVSVTAAVEDAVSLWLTTYGDPIGIWMREHGMRPQLEEPEHVD